MKKQLIKVVEKGSGKLKLENLYLKEFDIESLEKGSSMRAFTIEGNQGIRLKTSVVEDIDMSCGILRVTTNNSVYDLI